MKHKCHNCCMTFRTDGFKDDDPNITRCMCGIRFTHYQRKADNLIVVVADANDRRTSERIGL